MAYIRSGTGGNTNKEFVIPRLGVNLNVTGYATGYIQSIDVSEYNTLTFDSYTYTGNPNTRTCSISGDNGLSVTYTAPVNSKQTIDISDQNTIGISLRIGIPANPKTSSLNLNNVVFSS